MIDYELIEKNCIEQCTEVNEKLIKELSGIGFEIPKCSRRFNFRLTFPTPIGKDKNITKLSVSIPLDAMGNRDPNEYPKCIETALFSDTNIEYDESLGYEDVKKFYGQDRASEQSNVLKLKTHILTLYTREKCLDNDKIKKKIVQNIMDHMKNQGLRPLTRADFTDEAKRKVRLERALKDEAERKLELVKKQRDEAEARYKEAEVDNDKKNVCVVCLENKKTHAFNPCGHMCVCETCADEIIQRGSNCPMCRGDITSLLKIFT